jgi:hypothetical protein
MATAMVRIRCVSIWPSASGKFNQQEITQTFQDPGISGFIQKPYSLAELRKKLRAVLDAA